MIKEPLGERLAREAREYLTDLRELRDELKTAEGWIAFGLLIMAGLMLAIWAIISLGFSPPNDHILAFLRNIGLRTCRPIDNFSGVVIFVNLFLMMFLTVVTLGNVFNMMRRVREGLPRAPRELIISTSLMLIAGIGGIVFMLWIC
jgi:hypothetical protein